jgi:AcrR family transcriptional regulator
MRRTRIETSPARTPGRPRSDEAHAAILAASIALVRDVGYDAVAMDAIAARAGVGKATLYRRWSSKESLVADALEGIMVRRQMPDTGSTRGDLRAVMRDTVRMYEDPATTGLLSGLVAAMARSPQIAAAVREGFVKVRRETVRQVIKRGIARGDLRKTLDVDLAIDLLSGPLVLRTLVTGGPVDDTVSDRTVDMLLKGFST